MKSAYFKLSKLCCQYVLAQMVHKIQALRLLDILEECNFGKNVAQKTCYNSKSAEKRGLIFKYVKIQICTISGTKIQAWTTLDFLYIEV